MFWEENFHFAILTRSLTLGQLGKPAGTLQKTMYDSDKQRIFDLYKLGVPLHKIISTHLGYGKYLSLKKFIDKRYSIDLLKKPSESP